MISSFQLRPLAMDVAGYGTKVFLMLAGLAACVAPQPQPVATGCPVGMTATECTAFRRQQFLADKGCAAGEAAEHCEARQRQQFQASVPALKRSAPAAAQRFPEILAQLSVGGMSSVEQAVVKRCKQQAEAVYNMAVAIHAPGSYQPDIVATGRLRDCMIADAPGR
jgi:hypothetical protein